MSKGPFSAAGEFLGSERTNRKLRKDEWCTYGGECGEDLNLYNLCHRCIYQRKFDIPKMLRGEIEKNGSNKQL